VGYDKLRFVGEYKALDGILSLYTDDTGDGLLTITGHYASVAAAGSTFIDKSSVGSSVAFLISSFLSRNSFS
jgi:hypothetical protein